MASKKDAMLARPQDERLAPSDRNIPNDLDPEQLEELRDSATALANVVLRRHRKIRELIVQIDQLIDATARFQKSLWRRS